VPVEDSTGKAVVSPAASTLRDEMAVSGQRLSAPDVRERQKSSGNEGSSRRAASQSSTDTIVQNPSTLRK